MKQNSRPPKLFRLTVIFLSMTISNGSLADSFSVNSESGAAYETRGLSWTKSLSETDSEQMHLQSIEIDGSRVKSEITDTIGTSVSNQTSFSAGLGFEAGASGLDTTLMKSGRLQRLVFPPSEWL